jgi:cytochrome c oxidase subunit 2
MGDTLQVTGAAEIGRLTWALTILGGAVFVVFLAALVYAVTHRRDDKSALDATDDPRAIRMILVSGAVVPAIVLVPLLLWTMRSIRQLHPDNATTALVIDIVARQWWWEARYRDSLPARSFTTANEIHIPVGRRVELRLTSPEVIHSFWVPALQGKTDHIPGKENITWIAATAPGVYRGLCAEFCGTQHANMGITVVAQEQGEFEQWTTAQLLPAAEPVDSLALRGRDLFLASGCALCHAVRGTTAGGAGGPDLTHLASRRTLAAGRLTNTPQNLAGWIANPHGFKPGTRMPALPLTGEQFNLIHRYLQQLR